MRWLLCVLCLLALCGCHKAQNRPVDVIVIDPEEIIVKEETHRLIMIVPKPLLGGREVKNTLYENDIRDILDDCKSQRKAEREPLAIRKPMFPNEPLGR